MTSLPIGSIDRWPLVVRVLLLLLLFFVQIEIVEIAMRRFYDGTNIISQSVWAPIAGYQIYMFSFVVVFPAAFAIIAWQRLSAHLSGLMASAATHHWLPWIALQGCAYALFVGLTYQLSAHPHELGDSKLLVFVTWGIAMLATFLFWLFALAPRSFWTRFVRAEYQSLVIAAVAAICVTGGKQWLEAVAPSLGMMTLAATEFVARLAFDEVVINLPERILGTPDFSVTVSNACAGYEGITLITVFLATYLWLFRQDFRFPRVLIVFPIGIAVIWLFNVLRISALIAIGDSVSAEIAMAGFHSNAGWIAFILVSLGTITLLHHSPVFASHSGEKPALSEQSRFSSRSLRASEALLIPFVIMMAMTLLTAAFSAGFDWLYPLKVVGTGAALWVLWGHYRFDRHALTTEPIAIGVLVFFLWLLLVPASAQQDEAFAVQISAVAPPLLGLWLFFRLIGSAIIVPLAEELVFRGYLLARLAGKTPAIDQPVPFTWLSFLVSSVLFGLLHDAWVAGALAGMAYGLARYRRGRLGDAVIAHMTTNLLLSLYAITTQHWSYW